MKKILFNDCMSSCKPRAGVEIVKAVRASHRAEYDRWSWRAMVGQCVHCLAKQVTESTVITFEKPTRTVYACECYSIDGCAIVPSTFTVQEGKGSQGLRAVRVTATLGEGVTVDLLLSPCAEKNVDAPC